MPADTINLSVIAVGAAALIWMGGRGIKKRKDEFKRKDLAKADYILSIGELICGLMYAAYLVFLFVRK